MEKYDELLIGLRQVIRAIDLYSKKLNKESGLTGPQLLVLQAIANRDGVLAKQVADAINLSSATVTSILDRLEARDLVKRERSTQDKRKVLLHLTEKGEQAVGDAPKPLQQHFIDRFEKLEDWEQNMMIANMQRIAKMMNADDIDAAPVLEVGTIQQLSE
ncbi:MarR family transcriptional regulator [Alteromonas sp. ASW11-36]|uniref:MarR family transcriptional regulator n=1 Tax=Alteromonas arenosi TaxID=3055817 RepID=A0ABT7SUM6_9ALTE|nr:MarR family transcriptional regulator [Alteromonas sp. ASW11-36]MDM7859898.1 MarR family transcriptional regulator [Alteromonas sp. ASW11-36]